MMDSVKVEAKEPVQRTEHIKGYGYSYPALDILKREFKDEKEYTIECKKNNKEGFGFVVRMKGENIKVEPLQNFPKEFQFFESYFKNGYFSYPSKVKKNEDNFTILSCVPYFDITVEVTKEYANEYRLKITLDAKDPYLSRTYQIPFEKEEQPARNRFFASTKRW